jgi:hypothetical protein
MKKAIALLLISGASAAWCAEGAGITGPVSGYVVDGRYRAIRPINGIPGAARLGAAVELPFAIDTAAIAAAQDYALVTAANSDGRPSIVRGLRSGAAQAASIDGAIATKGIAIADSGAAAALYSATQLQFVSGLPTATTVDDAIDIGVTGGVTAAAIDATGRNVLLLGRDGGVYLAARGADLKQVARMPGAVSASFVPGADDVVVANADTGDVVLLHGLSGSLTIRTVAGAANGLNSARSVRAISGSEIGVVDGEGRLGVIATETGSIEWIGLAGAAERIDTLDRGLLVLNHAGAGPLLLLDIQQGHTPYFVPGETRKAHHRK